MIGILCPSAFEYQALRSLKFPKSAATFFVSGMGKVRSLHACHEIRRKHSGLKGILLVGFAGGLTPDLNVGDLVEPTLFIEHDYDARPFERYPNCIKKGGRGSSGVRLFPAAIDSAMLTQDRFLKENPYAKLGSSPVKNKPVACDMESYAVAYFCERSKLRYSAVKLISDTADENADHDFLKACKKLAPALVRTVSEGVRRMQRPSISAI